MIFNEIKCRVSTSLGLVGGWIPCIPHCVCACLQTACKFFRVTFQQKGLLSWRQTMLFLASLNM